MRQGGSAVKFWIVTLSLVIAFAQSPPARADDVTEQINEALTAYNRKDLPTAIAGLEAALNIIRQSRADAYGAQLPAPPAGWKADAVETISAGVAMVGGGTGASRVYHKGNDTVTVQILADSPMMQAMSTLASNGMAAMGGMRTQIVNGRRTLYIKDDGAFMTFVGDHIMVRVEGKGQPEETLKQFLTAVDFAAVEKAGK
jgi:hypothetical protein